MEEYKREEFPMISKIYHIIVENHKPANHTLDILLKNKDVTNFCEVARHFIEIPYPKKSIYLHYDVASWYNDSRVRIRIESITIYDDHYKFLKAKLKALYSGKPADIPNIN